MRHHIGFPEQSRQHLHMNFRMPVCSHWRRQGEKHAWNPHTIARIQQAARTGDKSAYKDFSKLVNAETTRACHLRGLLKFRKGEPVPLAEVESVTRNRQTILHRGHELRFDLGRSARNAGDRHESYRWQEQHGRRRRAIRSL